MLNVCVSPSQALQLRPWIMAADNCAKMAGALTPNQVFQLVNGASQKAQRLFLRSCAMNMPRAAYDVIKSIRNKDLK